MIKAIIFDLDGVIIDSENTVWKPATAEFVKNHGAVFNREKMIPLMIGKTLEQGVEILQEHYDIKGDIKKLADERRQIVMRYFQKNVTFTPGFLDFYKQISGKYRLAVATSIEKPLYNFIDKHLRISELFDNHIYTISDVGNISKPDPAIFLYAANKIKTSPETCVVIEDSPLGVEAAKRAGMKCIALALTVSREKLSKADEIVDSFDRIDVSKF